MPDVGDGIVACRDRPPGLPGDDGTGRDILAGLRARVESIRIDELRHHARRISRGTTLLADEVSSQLARTLIEPVVARADLDDPCHRQLLDLIGAVAEPQEPSARGQCNKR